MAAGRVVRCVALVLAVAFGSAAILRGDDDVQKQREEALQRIGDDFPAHYREVIEEYFKRLANPERE